jgi:hypothetical protein
VNDPEVIAVVDEQPADIPQIQSLGRVGGHVGSTT